MSQVVWFDGLGSAVVGGVVAALVAVFVTRAQLKHDRRMRRDESIESAALQVHAAVTELRPWRGRMGYTQPDLNIMWNGYRRLLGAVEAARLVADREDRELLAWLEHFGHQLEGEVAHGSMRRGKHGVTLHWVLASAEQVPERLRDRRAELVTHERPSFASEQ